MSAHIIPFPKTIVTQNKQDNRGIIPNSNCAEVINFSSYTRSTYITNDLCSDKSNEHESAISAIDDVLKSIKHAINSLDREIHVFPGDESIESRDDINSIFDRWIVKPRKTPINIFLNDSPSAKNLKIGERWSGKSLEEIIPFLRTSKRGSIIGFVANYERMQKREQEISREVEEELKIERELTRKRELSA